MPFRPPNDLFRERILSFGGAGLGKSFDFYTIAKRAVQTKSDAMFYVIDTDVSVGRMLTDAALAPSLMNADGTPVNVVSFDVYDWESTMEAIDTIYKHMRPQDWLMIDMISPTWDWCQDHFTNEVFKKDLVNYFLQARQAMKPGDKKMQAFEGWKDWPVMKQMFGVLLTKILRCPGNVYCTAEVKAINTDSAEKDTKLMFGPHGVVPVGQKRIPHVFSTVLWKTSSIPGEWQIVTVKDRSRPYLEGKTVTDFSITYLVQVAGWKLA